MELRIVNQNGVNVVESYAISSKKIANTLNKDHQDVKKKIKKILTHGSDFSVELFEVRGKKAYEFILTKNALKILLSTYTGLKKEDYIKLGVDDIDIRHTYTRFEMSFGIVLVEALKEIGLSVKKQYSIGEYRIDFYITERNIAVEYDESQHFTEKGRTSDSKRQKQIEDLIGCKFIRCDYRDSDIKNVMKVLKEVM